MKVINISKEAISVNQISKSILKRQVVKRRTGSDSEIGNATVNRPTQGVCEAEVFILSVSPSQRKIGHYYYYYYYYYYYLEKNRALWAARNDSFSCNKSFILIYFPFHICSTDDD